MPDLALDNDIRAAAFAYVQRLRARHGGRIPASELSVEIQFQGQRVPIWNYQKGIFKAVALGRDGAALSVQSSVESPYEDEHDPDAGHFIYKYRGTDPNHPDNLALRSAMTWQRPILYLVGIDPGI